MKAAKLEDIKIFQGTGKKTVRNCMTRNAEYIEPESSLKEAANQMLQLNTGSLPVGNGDRLVGFITDRDIATKAAAQGLDPEETTVEQIMSKKVLYCYEDSELDSVTENMKANEVLRLVVLDRDKNFVGVITHSQICRAAVEENNPFLCRKVSELACYNKQI